MGIAFQGFLHEDGEKRLAAYLAFLAAQPRKESVAVFH
jgi:hypothetical protein